MTTLFAFLFVLGVLVFIHELGHFLLARWHGVRVITFSLGFGPICHVGCFNASIAVTFESASSVRPRNGPPDAVRIKRRISPDDRPCRHW